jgi:hypothetical protein
MGTLTKQLSFFQIFLRLPTADALLILERHIASDNYSNVYCFRSIFRRIRLLGSRYVYQLIDAGRRCVHKTLSPFSHVNMPFSAKRKATNKLP